MPRSDSGQGVRRQLLHPAIRHVLHGEVSHGQALACRKPLDLGDGGASSRPPRTVNRVLQRLLRANVEMARR